MKHIDVISDQAIADIEAGRPTQTQQVGMTLEEDGTIAIRASAATWNSVLAALEGSSNDVATVFRTSMIRLGQELDIVNSDWVDR